MRFSFRIFPMTDVIKNVGVFLLHVKSLNASEVSCERVIE
jgi:hypothetical protein